MTATPDDIRRNKRRALRELAETLQHTTVPLMADLKAALPTLPPEELADIAFQARRTAETLDAVRKAAQQLSELAQKIACLICVNRGIEGPLRGEDVIASLSLKMSATLPKRDEPEYVELMRWCGIDAETTASDVVRPHWPTLTDRLSEALQRGERVPIDPEKQHPVYSLIMRPRKTAEEEGE